MNIYSASIVAISIGFTLMVHNNASAAEPSSRKSSSSSVFSRGLLGPKATFDPRMVRAAEIAKVRAYPDSRGYCWRFVKNALVASGVIESRPTTIFAKQAAAELAHKYGFTKLDCKNPYKAPQGSVIVYGGEGAGHIEFRTKSGFASDYYASRHSARPLIGIYAKF